MPLDQLNTLLAHAMGLWLVLAGICLVIELATQSGWMLWPAASALITAMLAAVTPLKFPFQVLAYAWVTMVLTVGGRHFIGTFQRRPLDSNERTSRVVGLVGEATAAFSNGVGRVLVDGREWAAVADHDGDIRRGDRVFVVSMIDDTRLQVRRSGD
jgi:membrane protein implicated in regulation of membrane protease activity